MRRVFFHVDEFGEMGMSHLPLLTCLSDPLVVWSPSALLLDQAHSQGDTFLGSAGLLKLVKQEDSAPVRIIGREEWILDESFRRTHPWPYATWVKEFDSVIKGVAIEDASRPLDQRRVIIADPEKGDHEARRVLNDPGGQAIANRLRKLYRQASLPLGILEKAKRAELKRSSVPAQILRDIYNHSLAMVSAGTSIAATPSEHMFLLQQIAPGTVTAYIDQAPAGKGLLSSGDFREALKVISKIEPLLNERKLRRFLRSGLRNELHELLYSSRSLPLDSHIVQDIMKATEAQGVLSRIFKPDDPIGLTASLGTLTLLFTSLFLNGTLKWGWIPLLAELSKDPLRRLNRIPAQYKRKHRTRSLFYLAFGITRPTQKQIREMLKRLEVSV